MVPYWFPVKTARPSTLKANRLQAKLEKHQRRHEHL